MGSWRSRGICSTGSNAAGAHEHRGRVARGRGGGRSWVRARGACGAAVARQARARVAHRSGAAAGTSRERGEREPRSAIRRSRRAREQLQAVFGELARDSLQSNSEVFLQLARERLSRQQLDASAALKERETAIESMVQPIRDALAKTEAQMHSIERDRIDALATIKSQMEMLASGQSQLSRETRNLVTALRRPDVRGQWGEITLKRLVELAGMSAHVDFTEQPHQPTESGAIRPDMIVHMPDRRDIVVDVKTPLDAYLAAAEAQSDEARSTQLKRHAQLVGARVRELSSKQYWSQFANSPDFVVLFLPGDQFLSAALQEKPGTDRRVAAAKRHAGDAHQPRRPVEGGRVRLEANHPRRQRGRDTPARRGLVQAARGVRRAPWEVGQITRQQRRFIQQSGRLARTAGDAGGAALSGARIARQPRAGADRCTSTLWRAHRDSRDENIPARPPMRPPPRPLEEPYRGRAVPPGSARYWSWLFAAPRQP